MGNIIDRTQNLNNVFQFLKKITLNSFRNGDLHRLVITGIEPMIYNILRMVR